MFYLYFINEEGKERERKERKRDICILYYMKYICIIYKRDYVYFTMLKTCKSKRLMK